jgi:hypothetical protein
MGGEYREIEWKHAGAGTGEREAGRTRTGRNTDRT